MNAVSRALGVAGGVVLSIVGVAATLPLASAAPALYPPGWNEPATNLPPPSLNFRTGCGWGDSQRYWPDQTGCGTPKSHAISYGPVIYEMNPRGERYHRVD